MQIACICTGNTCRSPMLEALLKDALAKAGVDAAVSSAGVAAQPGAAASAHSVTCMAERGLDIRSHKATNASQLDLGAIDMFWCMSTNHAMALFDAGVPQERLFVCNGNKGGVPDPFGGDLTEYRHCADVLETCAAEIATALSEQS